MGSKVTTQQLLPGERVIISSEIASLTNFRVFRDATNASDSRYVSITLSSVASCGFETTSQPMWIVLGLLVAFGGLAVPGDERWIVVGIGIFIALLYFFTKTAHFVIHSNGGQRIAVAPSKLDRLPLLQFANEVDRAKLAFVADGRADRLSAA